MRAHSVPDRSYLLLGGALAFTLAAPLLAPHEPDAFSLSLRLQGLSLEYPLGTDHLGRCVLSRLLYGFHVTPVAAFAIVAVAASIGSVLGLLSGYVGGVIDQALMRVVEGVFIFPAVAVALTISAVLGLGMGAIIVSLGAVHWAEYARVVRNLTVTEKTRTYVLAAEALGASPNWVAFRHILPNVMHAILVLIPFSMSWAILSFSGLSYLGLGAEPGSSEWGLMIAEGRVYMRDHAVLVLAPGLMILSVVIFLNTLGDRLRDRFA